MSSKKKSGWCERKSDKYKDTKEEKKLKMHDDKSSKTSKKKAASIEAKVVLLGDSGVGKTAISTKYTSGYFPDTTAPTLGGSYNKKEVTLKNGERITLHIWDTAGSESSRAMLPLYYRDAAAGLITYDIGNERSFEHVEYWSNELSQKLKPGSFTIALVGNKNDIPEDEKKITTVYAYKYAKEHDYLFAEISAKTGDGVSEILINL